ncbi:MAG: class B sortase [Clostridiales bacterium]|nr:class B sortase [Clostridiales bacterium]
MATDFNNKDNEKENFSFTEMANHYTDYDANEKISERISPEQVEPRVSVAGEAVAVKSESGFKKVLKSIFPNKNDPATEVLRKIVLLVSVIILIVCAPIVGKRLYQKGQFASEQKDISSLVDNSEGTSEEWAALKAQYPDVVFPEGMQYKFAKLYALNQDMVGWLKIEGTSIDFPIVQGADNSEYLHLNFHRKNTDFGNPFLDYRNTITTLNKNTIIYGHHMRDKTIFAQLETYATIDGFKKSPIIEFDTLFQDYKFKVYAVFITNSELKDDNNYIFNYIYTSFRSPAKFQEFITQIDQRKLYTTGVDINADDKIITLSTCDYTFDDARFVVVGRLVREGEDLTVDTSKAVMKESPRFPQAYYDKKKIANPYKDAAQWDQ